MIGMPALIEYDSLEDNLKLCKELNLDFIELNMNLPMYNEMDVEGVKALLVKYNIKVSLHLSELFNPFDLDPILRAAHLESFKRVVTIANELEANLINMHLLPGIYFKLPKGKVFLNEQYKNTYLLYVHQFLELVSSLPIRKLCIENTGIHHFEFIQEATDILLSSPKIYLTYDIGHDITSGYNDKAYYTNHISDTSHYHIHDGTTTSNHLPLFTGELDIEGFIKRAHDNQSSYVIEVKSSESLIASINSIKERKII